jgi:hypothetical protein
MTRPQPDPHRSRGLDLGGALGATVDSIFRVVVRLLARVGILK